MAASRAIIEVAPSASYLLSNIAQDDVVIRTESALRTLYLGASNTLPLRVSAAGVYVAGTLTADAYSNVPDSAAATFASNLAPTVTAASAASTWASNAIPTKDICDLADLLQTRRWLASNATFSPYAQFISSAMGTLNPFSTVQYNTTAAITTTVNGQLVTYTPSPTVASVSNYTSAANVFGTPGASTHTMEINQSLLLPANATLQQVIMSASNVAGGIKAAVVQAQPDLTNVKVVYATPFWLGLPVGNLNALTLPTNYTVPNDGSNYYAAVIRTSNANLYHGNTSLYANVTVSAASIDTNGVYATTSGGSAWGYKATYIPGGAGPTVAGANVTFDQTWACRCPLLRPSSNVTVVALAGLGGPFGVSNIAALNSTFAIDASSDGGATWTQVTLSNYGHFDQATMHVGGKAVLPTAGTAPGWRIRMPYINTSACGIAMRFT